MIYDILCMYAIMIYDLQCVYESLHSMPVCRKW